MKENGFNTSQIDVHTDDKSWTDTYNKAKDVYAVDPNFIPNTYLKYYLYRDYVVKHSDLNYTRTDEVREGREKRVFEEARRLIQTKNVENCGFEVGNHAEYIVDLARALAYNTQERMLLIQLLQFSVQP